MAHRKFLLALLLSALASVAGAEEYFLRADGVASAVNAASGEGGACGAAATAMDLDTMQGGSYDTSDDFTYCDDGGTFRVSTDNNVIPQIGGTQSDPSSHAAAAGDTPILSAAHLSSGWVSAAGTCTNCWSTTWASAIVQLFADDTRYQERDAASSCADTTVGEWCQTGGTVYLYAASDPDALFTSPGVEITDAASKNFVINFTSGIDHTLWDGLTIKHAAQYNFSVNDKDLDGLVFRNMISTGAFYAGARFVGADDTEFTGLLIEDSTFQYNGGHGSTVGRNTWGAIYRRNTNTHNAHYAEQILPDESGKLGPHTFLANCKFVGLNVRSLLVEHNICSFANTTWPAASRTAQKGNGLWTDVDHHPPSLADGTEMRYNWVEGNTGQGIRVEITNYAKVHHNVISDNLYIGLAVAANPDGNDLKASSLNVIAFNTVYGGGRGLQLVGNCVDCSINNYLYGNIVLGQTGKELYISNGGSNDGTNGSGNIIKDNCFGVEAASEPDFYLDGDVSCSGVGAYDCMEAWLAAERASDPPIVHDDTLEVDPLFTNAGAGDFTLQVGSPMIGACDAVADYLKMALGESAGWVDTVYTEDQGDHGAAWECGAYVYEE